MNRVAGDFSRALRAARHHCSSRRSSFKLYAVWHRRTGGSVRRNAPTPDSFIDAWRIARASGLETVVIGGGTNLIVSDAGFRGVVLKLSNDRIRAEGETVHVESGASLQALVDFTVDAGLKGLETMTGIPGSAGAAIYGNAGAYGHSIAERVSRVRFFDGAEIREFNNAQCEFHYRESIFKRHKEWIIFSAELAMERGDAAALRETADKILAIRNRKYPPTMKCAGQYFQEFSARRTAGARGE